VLGHWWYCFYERLWAIRGMQNVLMDFIEHPAELKRLSRAILDHHVKAIRAFAACGVHGIFTSDDLGSQRSLMMSPAIFRKLLKPLYAELFAECHALGLHFWLHACGNISAIMSNGQSLRVIGMSVFDKSCKLCYSPFIVHLNDKVILSFPF
jgi:uroporphyrinogen decarboxylase